jgi:prefoldin subunit 5
MGVEQPNNVTQEYIDLLRAEIAVLRKQITRLENSIETWKALANGWQFLAESKTISNE